MCRHPVLLSEPPLNPAPNREKITQIMFETYSVPAFSLMPSPVLCLYKAAEEHSLQSLTGIVIESGHATTTFSPVYEGCLVRHLVKEWNFGGKHVTEQLAKLLNIDTSLTSPREEVSNMKNNICFVSQDYARDMAYPAAALEKEWEMADGEVISVSTPRFQCTECIFQPQLMDPSLLLSSMQLGHKGIHQICADLLTTSAWGDVPLTETSGMENILLSGANTCFAGLKQRFEKELRAAVTGSSFQKDSVSKLKVHANDTRAVGAFAGGAVLSSLSTFANMCMSKADYDEFGPKLVHRICCY